MFLFSVSVMYTVGLHILQLMDGTHFLNGWRIVVGEGVRWKTLITWLPGQNFARGPREIRTSSGCGRHFFSLNV